MRRPVSSGVRLKNSSKFSKRRATGWMVVSKPGSAVSAGSSRWSRLNITDTSGSRDGSRRSARWRSSVPKVKRWWSKASSSSRCTPANQSAVVDSVSMRPRTGSRLTQWPTMSGSSAAIWPAAGTPTTTSGLLVRRDISSSKPPSSSENRLMRRLRAACCRRSKSAAGMRWSMRLAATWRRAGREWSVGRSVTGTSLA